MAIAKKVAKPAKKAAPAKSAVQATYTQAPRRRVGRQPRDREEAGGGRAARFGDADSRPWKALGGPGVRSAVLHEPPHREGR